MGDQVWLWECGPKTYSNCWITRANVRMTRAPCPHPISHKKPVSICTNDVCFCDLTKIWSSKSYSHKNQSETNYDGNSLSRDFWRFFSSFEDAEICGGWERWTICYGFWFLNAKHQADMMFVYTMNISHQTTFSAILVGFLHASNRYDTWCKYFASNCLQKISFLRFLAHPASMLTTYSSEI